MTTEKPIDVTNWKIPCETYSRIVGYLRPTQNWNVGKRQEYRERKVFKLPTDPPKPRKPLVDVGFHVPDE